MSYWWYGLPLLWQNSQNIMDVKEARVEFFCFWALLSGPSLTTAILWRKLCSIWYLIFRRYKTVCKHNFICISHCWIMCIIKFRSTVNWFKKSISIWAIKLLNFQVHLKKILLLTLQKMMLSIRGLFSKCHQVRSFMQMRTVNGKPHFLQDYSYSKKLFSFLKNQHLH